MNTQIIFVDCFDTLVHRREHPYQIINRWAKCLSRLYPAASSESIEKKRFLLMKSKEIEKNGVYGLYKELASILFAQNTEVDKLQFAKDARELEIWCEISTLYKNKKICDFLRRKSKKIPIYCLTDFHFSSEDMKLILDRVGIDFLSGVYSSASYGATKHEGDLYRRVTDLLNVRPSNCVMIGDNKLSDVRNARNAGFRTCYRPHLLHQYKLKIQNKLHYSHKVNSLDRIGKEIWRNSDCYEEYTIVFFIFCSRLYKAVKERNKQKIIFLAREGYFLKKCFEIYQQMCVPVNERIKTDYLMCSRRAIHSVQEDKCKTGFFTNISVKNFFRSIGFMADEAEIICKELLNDIDTVIADFPDSEEAREINSNPKLVKIIKDRFQENQAAFRKYVLEKADSDNMILVDVGWIGRMQQGVSVLFPQIETVGYYLGIYQNLFEEPYVERHGLIFHKDEKESRFFNIFRANIQFYEQLLAAPHGSACFYRFDGDERVKVVQEWDEREEGLYRTVIQNVQSDIEVRFSCLCTRLLSDVACDVYADSDINRKLAQVMLRSALIQSEKRLCFMKRCVSGFSQNFQQQTTGMVFRTDEVQLKMIDVVRHPDRYVRYAAKLGIVFEKKGFGAIGRFMMKVFYFYTRSVCRL